MTEPIEKQTTKHRLLESACIVFAESGYRGATVAEICARAEANIAAVNYHFGDKERLYIEAWREAMAVSMEKYPADGGVSDDASPEDRLHGRVDSLVRKVMDEGKVGHLMRFLIAEISVPSGKMLEAIEETVQPFRREMLSIIRELAGPEMSEQEVMVIARSVFHMCIGLTIRPEMRKKFFGQMGITETLVVDTVTQIVLGGIREMRKCN